jgi:iron complex outermembrane receptor protein/vitamin B12 transporter
MVMLLVSFATAAGAEQVYTVPEETVTGSRLATSLEEVPAPTYVITQEQIERSGSRDLATILEQNVPGMYVKQKSGFSNSSQVTIRGYVTEILVLVDGVPYYRSSHAAGAASVDFRNFPITNIERIEVVKGAGSAIYGSMAAGGVINIITKKATQGGTIEGEIGSNDWRRYYVRGEGSGEGLNAGIWYSHKEEGAHRLLKDTFSNKDFNALKYKEDAYGLNLSGKNWFFKSEIGEYKNDYETPGWLTPIEMNKEKGEYQRHTFRFNGDSYYILMGYDDQKYFILQNDDNYYKDRAFTTEFAKRSQWGSTLASWGLYFRREESTFRSSFFDPEVDQKRTNYAPFVELSRPIGDIIGTLGLRYEIWRQDDAENYNEFMPKLTFQYPLDNGSMWYIAAGRFFAMPSIYELHAQGPWGTVGNPNLKPEKGWNYDLGIKGSDATGNWNVGLFYSDMEDKIIWRNNTYENVDQFKSYGLEIMRQWNIARNWTWGLSGTWMKAQEKKSNEWVNSYGFPEWLFKTSIEHHSGSWTSGLALSYLANRNGYSSSDDYFQTDIFTEWKSGDHTVRLSCYNLFDKEFIYSSSTWDYYGPERSIYLTWRYSF